MLPTLLFIMLAVKLEGPGPVLYSQMRLGRHGKAFRYLKFRTMKHDAENTATGPVFKLRSDPRVSRVGRFLRKTSLDELPALLNVIRGSMSIVGPRAALPLEAEHYSEVQRKRLELKPGLTGYWQVFGRAQEANTLDKMVQMDLEYADKQSLLFDLKILIRTVAVGLTRNAAQ
ncbi:MAG: sugar transferase [Nevskia sp.]|nr:sugar transferase [Nevskia sp.]MCK9384804.1 sugar transferase [Nevskia sp.]